MRKDAFLTVALLGACALIATLSFQARALRADYVAFVAASARPDVGEWMPSIATTDTAGHAVELGRAARSLQVLYFFEPWCPHCLATAPTMRRLDAVIERERLPDDVVGITTAKPVDRDAYLRAQRLPFPVVASTPRIRSLFRLHAIPLLIVVDRDGRVVYAHAGDLNTRDEVEHLMTAVRRTDAGPAVATTRK